MEQIVYSSLESADRATGVPHYESKGQIERQIAELKFRYATILRPTFFMEMVLVTGTRLDVGMNAIYTPNAAIMGQSATPSSSA